MQKNKSDRTLFRHWDTLLLGIILVIALVLRLYKNSTPLADLHSWRQVDTAAVARNFVRQGFDLLHPRYDDLSSIETGLENPQGYRYVEFPIYNGIFAMLFKYFPFLSLEVWGRLTTVFFSLVIIAVLYYLVLKEQGRVTAFFTGFFYATLPFFVFFSRVILPETTALALVLLAVLFSYLYVNSSKKLVSFIYFSAGLVLFMLALLTKPTVIFYGLPILIIFFQKHRFSLVMNLRTLVFFFIAILPFFWWRIYMKTYPEGIPANNWLITSVNTYQGLQNIFFRPAFFRWIFFERINQAILGGFLSVYLSCGLIIKQKRFILFSLILSGFIYLFVFQGGNVQHEYYQTLIFPSIAIALGLGLNFFLKNSRFFITPLVSWPLIVITILLSYFFSYYKVKDYYYYPPELPQIAKIVSTLTQPDDLIVTDRMGDTTLLYLIDRKGAPAFYKSPQELKTLGYHYLVTLNTEAVKSLKEQFFPVVFENTQFTLFRP